jgi:hypothetical protein
MQKLYVCNCTIQYGYQILFQSLFHDSGLCARTRSWVCVAFGAFLMIRPGSSEHIRPSRFRDNEDSAHQ